MGRNRGKRWEESKGVILGGVLSIWRPVVRGRSGTFSLLLGLLLKYHKQIGL